MIFKDEEIPEDLEELIPDFLKNTFIDYHELIKSFEQGDEKGMRSVCHRVLGTASSYGFFQMDELFTNLQNALHDKGIKDASEEVEFINEYFDHIKKKYQV